MKEHQHNGIWRIKSDPSERHEKSWGLYYGGREVANRDIHGVGDFIRCGRAWISVEDIADYKSTDSVYLLLPWEFME